MSRALFSEDGQTWHDNTPVDWHVGPTGSDLTVTKLVIGTPTESVSKDEDRKPITLAQPLPANLATLYPNLTHLHLWHIENLESLPPLPAGLKCLDVRGCERLREVGRLGDDVETLDLGDCTALSELPNASSKLQRLFVNDCTALDDDLLAAFLRQLTKLGASLIEFDGSRSPAVTSLKLVPRTLDRLVLQGCPNLADVSGLDQFTQLRHLNLSECPSLKSIPAISDQLQYVQLHGSEKLTAFLQQNIGPYDRGSSQKPNVVKKLASRKKFGKELTASAHAKLLLLGDGRVGKSTLAKRLQWDCLTPEQQRQPEFAELKPNKDETFTHKVRFNHWQTQLQLDGETAKEVNERAAVAQIKPVPCDSQGLINGAIRIWDFGGQEIYHQTHRIFAAEGSVYLIVWSPQELDQAKLRLQKPPHSSVSDEEWLEWNRQRSLDYWLDYVDSMRSGAKVALVCTSTGAKSDRVPWTMRSTKHNDRELDCFYIDSLEVDPSGKDICPQNREYQRLVKFIRSACGTEAARIGIVQPAFYEGVSQFVDGLLQANEAARRNSLPPENLLLPYEDWTKRVVSNHAQSGISELPLDADDVESITGYLHDAGHLFHIRDHGSPSVLIDQGWATDLIYTMLRPADNDEQFCLFNVIRKRGGYFDGQVLELDPHWKSLRSDAERQQLLQYMQQCGTIIEIQDEQESRENKALYLATEKWLLPKYEGHIEQRCEAVFQLVAKQPNGVVIEEFSFENQQISEFAFRSLMVHLGNLLKTRATFFRDGLQASSDDRLFGDDPQHAHNPTSVSWCFQLRWEADGADTFYGKVNAQLAASRGDVDELSRQIEAAFQSEGSPLARAGSALRRETRELDCFSHLYFRELRDSDFDVAISYSGRDKGIVQPLIHALNIARLRVYEYMIEECRYGEYRKVRHFMEGLRNPPCLLLFLSDSYLRNDPENWYCLWEFADAINRLKSGERSANRLVATYHTASKLTSRTIRETAIASLTGTGEHFESKYDENKTIDRAVAVDYRSRADHFSDAVGGVPHFADERGDGGTYSHYKTNADGSFDFSEILKDIAVALKQTKVSQ